MTKRTLGNIIMGIFIVWAIGFYSIASRFKVSKYDTTVIKVNTFPMTLCIALVVLSALYIARNLMVKGYHGEKVTIPNVRYIAIALGVTCAYLIVWNVLGQFYIGTFLYMMVLLTVFLDKEKMTKKTLAINACISLGTCLFAYLVFELVIGTKFVI